MPAVNSGRRVIESPPRSSNVYISLETMSVVSPIERAKTSVGSMTGTSTRLKPNNLRTRSKAATTAARRSASSPNRLCVPRTGCSVVIGGAKAHFRARRKDLASGVLRPLPAEGARRRREQLADRDSDGAPERVEQVRLVADRDQAGGVPYLGLGVEQVPDLEPDLGAAQPRV